MQGKAKVLSADEDAKAAALQWASEAAFGSTEVAAPKILGDIVESLARCWQPGSAGGILQQSGQA